MQRMNLTQRLLSVGLLVLSSTAIVRAGSLIPPAGPVGPTMKPLGDIEPKVAINATNTPGDATSQFKITQSGSYYLTGNIVGVSGKTGISITAGNVTIDLGGFECRGVAGAVAGIKAVLVNPVLTGICVRNGTISTWPGVGLDLSNTNGARISDVRAVGNGGGIYSGASAVVTNCSAIDCLNLAGLVLGVKSVAHNCSATGCHSDGISADNDCAITNCSASGNGDAGGESGFRLNPGCTMSGCSASGNFYAGVYVSISDATVTGCTMRNNNVGIYVQTASLVSGNTLVDNNTGILVNGLRSRIDGNNVFDGSAVGIQADAGLVNVIVRNTVQIQSNSTNCYVLGANNNVGTIVTLSATISTTNPWANFKN